MMNMEKKMKKEDMSIRVSSL